MEKHDVRKALRQLYAPAKGSFVIVDVPVLNYLMIDGGGDPNTSDSYARSVEALYTASYTLKFMSKAELHRDYVVPPLEGLWWSDDWSDFIARRKERWSWTMMIAVPQFIDAPTAERAMEKARSKKDLAELRSVRFDGLDEGLAVQTLHIGSYDDEAPVIRAMHEFAAEQGLALSGKHHEIYLSDPRRTAPEKLRTILRQPVTQPARRAT